MRDEDTPDLPPAGLVHDYLLVMRGAERTFAAIADLWPRAPVYTLLHDPKVMRDRLAGHTVTTSRLQRLDVTQAHFRYLLPVLPAAAERLPVHSHELVVSSSSAFAIGVRPAAGARHVCYCHSPFRYAWHEQARALQEMPRAAQPLGKRLLHRLRRWDLEASRRVTAFIANSRVTQRRIADFYERDSVIVHPPVEVDRFSPRTAEDYAVFVGEVVRHKQVELALEAAKRAGVPLKVVGTGPDLPRLQASYAASATFLGRIDDAALAEVLARARVAVVPNVEEFGIAAVEAQAAGRPVLAADAGGAQETVINGETGVLVPAGSVDAFAEALRHVDFDAFAPSRMVENARRFSPGAFKASMTQVVVAARA